MLHDDDPLAPGPDMERERVLREAVARMVVLPQRPTLQPLAPMPFLPTSAFDRIRTLVDTCLFFQCCGLVIGAPGIGKTMALRELLRRSEERTGPEVAMMKVEPTYRNSAVAVYEELAPLIGCHIVQRSAAISTRHFKRSMSRRPLILIDEAQNLSLNIASQLLSLSEECDLRMLFVGNPEVVKLVRSQQADIRLVSRRLAHRVELDCILDADADLVARHFGVADDAGVQLCRRIGKAFHVDGIVLVLRSAQAHAPIGAPIGGAAIRAALDGFPHIRDQVEASTRAAPVRMKRTAKPPRRREH